MPRWPLTTALPIAISLAILAISLTITIVGIGMLHTQNSTALEEKAAVFLDAVAGHMTIETSIEEETARTALVNSLLYPSVLGEEAVGLAWMANGKRRILVHPADTSEPGLYQALETTMEGTTNQSGFQIGGNDRGILTKTYLHNGTKFAISALFDAREVVEANRNALITALAINAALALSAAFISFAITKRALSPLRAFTDRLAREDPVPEIGRERSYMSAELGALETALALRQESEQARSNALERLAQVERDALLARVSATLAHEVRNPLAGILSALSTFRRYGEDKKIREETLDIVESGLRSLERIADVTLSTYRKRSGPQKITTHDIMDLKLLIGPEARKRNLVMDWDVPGNFQFTADGDAVRQILVNLLLNACKASPRHGKVTLDAHHEADGVRLSVIDQGTGMPAEVLSFLQSYPSTGLPPSRELGIWIVSELARDMGARIAVESRAGKGTAITLFIPTDDDTQRVLQ